MRLLIFVSFLLAVVGEHSVIIEKIDCNEPLKRTSAYTILNNERNTLEGWGDIGLDAQGNEIAATCRAG